MDDKNENANKPAQNEDKSIESSATDDFIPESNAAKLLKIKGNESDSHKDEEEIKRSFWGNIWYHYKAPILIFASFIIIIAIGATQIAKRDKPDVYLIYAGAERLEPNTVREMEGVLKSIMSEDYNGDGEKGVQFTSVTYLSDKVIAEREAAARENNYIFSVNYHANQESYETFSNEMLAGNSIVCLLDPSLYENVKEAGGFLELSEIFDEIPDGAIDEYGIKFSETKIYKYYSIFQAMPEDAVFAVRKVSTMSIFKGKKKAEDAHARHVEFAKDIINFEYPEDYEFPASTSENGVMESDTKR